MIQFCKILQDSENKRQRAQRRYEDEVKAREAKEKEIQDHEIELNKEKLKKDKIERKVLALKKYEDYLSTVIVNHNESYADINELLQRHRTLEKSNNKLEEAKNKIEQKLEIYKVETHR